jgi:HEAT repeat protein
MIDRQNSISKTGSRKEILREILVKRDFDELLRWAKATTNPIRTLTSFQFDTDKLISMRAVEALGVIGIIYADNDLEPLRKMITRLFWMMNDESGNVGWYAAEAIGETLRGMPNLIPEYAHMLPPFLVEEPFEKGTRIAIARIAEIDKSPFALPTVKKLIQTLNDPDPYIRGTSIIALKALKAEEAGDMVQALNGDDAEIELYDFVSGLMQTVAISQLAIDF